MEQRRLSLAVPVAFVLGLLVGGLGTAVLSQPPAEFVELESLRQTNRVLLKLTEEQRKELEAARRLLDVRSRPEPKVIPQ